MLDEPRRTTSGRARSQSSHPHPPPRPHQVVDDPQCTKSGVYWSWNGNAQQIAVNAKKAGAGGAGGEIFENQFSGMITDEVKGRLAYDYSMEAVKDYL